MTLQKPPHELVATVLGAGTMGAQIAAHFANCGITTHLLDIVPKGVSAQDAPAAKNALALGALKALKKSKPPALMSAQVLEKITAGNFDDDLEACASRSDIIVEAVIERLDIKQNIFGRLGKSAPKHCVLATNTSGIPVGEIVQALPPEVQKRIVGLHFFNPPRFMHLLELIPCEASAKETAWLQEIDAFCSKVLGKGVVLGRDTPNFVGNRIGVGEMLLTFRQSKGWTIEEIDYLNGPLMGRPKTGSFRLGDMVGIDVLVHVIGNLSEALSGDKSKPNYDPLFEYMVIPPMIKTLVERNTLGDKTKAGFYKKDKKEIFALDLESLEYRPRKKAKFAELRDISKIPQLPRRIHSALRHESKAGDFLRGVYLPLFNYAAQLVGSICESPLEIDQAMCWGYGWKAGPFAMCDAAEPSWVVEQLKSMNVEIAPALQKLVDQGSEARWYTHEGAKTLYFDAPSGSKKAAPDREGEISLEILRRTGGEIEKNATCGLLDLGDGVACVEFRSKMNTLDEGVLRMLASAPQTAKEKGFEALVVGNQGDDFCVGANLMQLMAWIMAKDFDAIDKSVGLFQDVMMHLAHCDIPVVAAPFGRTLGGGVELSMSADAIQAQGDSFMGLVEMGVGLLPAGGGLKEICRRADEWAAQVPNGDPYPWLRRGFEAAAGAKVSMSAMEAKETGWLAHSDGITMHRARLIADAKAKAKALATAGYIPPSKNAPIRVIGQSQGSSMFLGAKMFEWAGYASEHDRLIASKIAHVICGGDTQGPTTRTAQDLLDLEREAFVSLCGEAKSLARIQTMLQTGKPLRN